jgi:hypothetical protein
MRKKIIGILVLSLLVLEFNGIGHASLTDGLVAFYPFNGNANDESGNGNHGIVYGATLTTDRFGNANSAYSFDGISNHINCGHSEVLNVNHHTICAWIKTNGKGGNILGKVKPFEYETIQFSALATWFATGSEINHPLICPTTLVDGQNYFVAMTYDGSQVKFYINGVLSSCAWDRTGTVRINKNDMAIGRHGGGDQLGDDFCFQGIIDEVRIYNRALSDSEILELYTASAPPTCYETGFVAGVAYCKANPASCGINVNGGDAVTLTSDLKMHLPNIEYNVPFLGIISMWADLAYDPTKTDAAYFKVTGAGAN